MERSHPVTVQLPEYYSETAELAWCSTISFKLMLCQRGMSSFWKTRMRPELVGKVGTRLGRAGINIAQWRYGREPHGQRGLLYQP